MRPTPHTKGRRSSKPRRRAPEKWDAAGYWHTIALLTRHHHQSVSDILNMPLHMYHAYAEAAFKQLSEEFKPRGRR